MTQNNGADTAALTALVVDDNDYQRSMAIDQLRMVGCRRTVGARDFEQAWVTILEREPGIILTEWPDSSTGLDFLRRVRTSESSPNRGVIIFVLTNRATASEVEAARTAGANGFLRRPMATSTLKRWVTSAVSHPRNFIATETYAGPCRRRPRKEAYKGPKRRAADRVVEISAEEMDLQAQMARARVAALDAAARAFAPGDAAAARRVFVAAKELADLAEQINDATLSFGCREMMRYLQSQTALEKLDPEVVRTHVAALHQLAHLPRTVGAERDAVAQSLQRMVDKKLRQAAGG